ncbi:hypothetical protein D3C74_392010 [compost metagenome]
MPLMFVNKREKDVLNVVRALDADDRDYLSIVLKLGETSKKESIVELRRALILSHRKF